MGLFDWLLGGDADGEGDPERTPAATGSTDTGVEYGRSDSAGEPTDTPGSTGEVERSVGVAVAGGAFEPVIERGEELPAEATRTFTTAVDGQTSVEIGVYHGDSEVAADNEHLGTFQGADIPPGLAGEEFVDLQFSLADDRLTLSVDGAGDPSLAVQSADASTDRVDDRTVRVALE